MNSTPRMAQKPALPSTPQDFDRALAALYGGDTAALAKLLDEHPDLVHARALGDAKPYDGYFGKATLLHHVAGNPTTDQYKELPKNIVAIATLLLDRGAEVDAETVPGPSQPTAPASTTLGLVTSSAAASRAGVQIELMKLLAARGADLNAENGGPLMYALYYDEKAAAEELYKMGARVDVRAAAGLGKVDVLQKMFDANGTLLPAGRGLQRYPDPGTGADLTDVEIVSEALVFAAMLNQPPALEFLLDKKVNINAAPGNLHGASALHYAAYNNNVWMIDAAPIRRCARSITTAPRWAGRNTITARRPPNACALLRRSNRRRRPRQRHPRAISERRVCRFALKGRESEEVVRTLQNVATKTKKGGSRKLITSDRWHPVHAVVLSQAR